MKKTILVYQKYYFENFEKTDTILPLSATANLSFYNHEKIGLETGFGFSLLIITTFMQISGWSLQK